MMLVLGKDETLARLADATDRGQIPLAPVEGG
jgi:hypothetical protein